MEGRNKENSQLEERVGFSGLLKKERYEREREREREREQMKFQRKGLQYFRENKRLFWRKYF